MTAGQRGISLVEMLVVLAIVAILAVAAAVPRWDWSQRRGELAADQLAAALADALRHSRAGEDWRLVWNEGQLRLWRIDADEAGVAMNFPAGLRMLGLLVDQQGWPAATPLPLSGFATPPLDLLLDLDGQPVRLHSLPTGSVERRADGGAL
jgi:prepilin-type N-terminal cleavage/methylation domain-containing protein